MQQPARVEDQITAVVECFARYFQATHGGLDTGGVRVECQHKTACVAFELAHLDFRQGRAHGGNYVLEALLVHHDHIHVAFHDHRLVFAADGFARFIQPIQQAAFVEQVRLGRVHKFGDVIGSRTRPPKPVMLPLASRMGNIRRWRKRS